MRYGKLQIQIMPDAAIQNADLQQNRAFLRQVEEALLLGLVGQGKLTREQYDRCARALSEKAENVLKGGSNEFQPSLKWDRCDKSGPILKKEGAHDAESRRLL